MTLRANRLALLTVTAGITAGASLLMIGCDSGRDKANAALEDKITQARAAQLVNPIGSAQASFDAAATAARDPDVSPANAIGALNEQGNYALASGQAAIAQLAPIRVNIARLLWEINALTSDIRGDNILVAAWQNYDPSKPGAGGKSIKDSLADQQTQLQGSADKPNWIDDDKVPIPSLSKLTADIAKLNDQISQANSQRAQFVDQRNSLLDQADKAQAASEGETGQQSVDDFKKYSDLTKQAAMTTIQINTIDASLIPLQQDLAVAQGQQQVLQAASTDVTNSSSLADNAWGAIQAQIKAAQGQIKTIYDGSGDEKLKGLSLTDKASELADALQKASDLSDQAQKSLNAAQKSFEEAARLATSYTVELRTALDNVKNPGAEKTALENSLAILSPNNFKLRQANALQALASMEAANAQSLMDRSALQQAISPDLSTAGLAPPTGLDADLSAQASAAKDQANTDFDAAQNLLNAVLSGSTTTPDTRSAAQTGLAILQYDWSAYPWATQDSSGSSHLTLAQNAAQQVTDPVYMASLPGALQPAPTTEPTTAPAQ